MLRSPPVSLPYSRNDLGHPTSFAFASESVASAKLAPLGMMTRVGAPCGFPPHAATSTHPATSARRISVLNIEGLLKQNRRGEGINVALPAAGGFPEFSYCSQCCRRGKSFIIKTNGEGSTFRNFYPHSPHFG